MENELPMAEAVRKTETEAEEIRKIPQADPEEPKTQALKSALAKKEQALAALEDTRAKCAAAFEDFRKEFPNVTISELDESLWEQVKSGIPLAAAYALKLHRENKKSGTEKRERAPWQSLDESAADSLYTPAEVKRMSEAEVRRNYDRIRESMKHW